MLERRFIKLSLTVIMVSVMTFLCVLVTIIAILHAFPRQILARLEIPLNSQIRSKPKGCCLSQTNYILIETFDLIGNSLACVVLYH